MKPYLFSVILLLGLPAIVPAQTTEEMHEQIAGELEKADQAMNAAYRKLMAILNDEGKKRLTETQRAWIIYRDAQASFDSHLYAGGTAAGLQHVGSLNELTKARTKRLNEDFANFKELE